MQIKHILTRALTAGLSLLFSFNVFAQSSVQYEMIDVSVQSCLDSWAKNGASEPSRKACIFATATPKVKYESALSKYGEQNNYTQYAAYALLRANYYVTESYIALIPNDNISPAWVEAMCRYNAEAMKLSHVPFYQLQPAQAKFAKDISPRLSEVDQVCKTLP